MTPELVHREMLTTETSTEPSSKGGDWLPLQHIEANVVSIKVTKDLCNTSVTSGLVAAGSGPEF